MATFTWQFDAPSGVYKSHAMSRRLYEAALEETKFMDFVRPVEGFGKKMGDTVTLTRIANITEPTSAVLQEGVRIPEDEFSMSTYAITVEELGRAVPFTSFAEDLSEFDLQNPIQRKLKSQWGLVMDTLAATAFKTAKVKYIPTASTAGTFDTDGTASTQATNNLNFYHVEQIRDYLYDTLLCAPYAGDDYVGIFRTLALRGLKDDSHYEVWHQYTDPQAKYNGEVGRIEKVRFIETNHANALAKKGLNSMLGEGVIFGEDPVAMAEVLSPELRASMPEDFGRAKAVAWYAILKFAIVWDTANAGEARIVHVTSS